MRDALPSLSRAATPGGEHRRRWLEPIGLGLVLLLYAAVLWLYFVPTVGGTDANGYHVSARMLERHGRFYQVQPDEFSFVSEMWVVNDRGEFYPKYPPLYPALAGAAQRWLGGDAGLWISPVCAWLAVLGTYVLCRSCLPRWAAVLAALIVATNPVLNTYAVHQVSHATEAASLTWAYALFFVALRRAGGRRRGALLGTGLLLGLAIGVRYPDALLVVPPLLWLWWRGGERWRTDVVALLAGLALPGAFLAAYHWTAFGSPFATGYSLTEEQSAFALANIGHHLGQYCRAIAADVVGPLVVLSLCGFVAAWWHDRRTGAFYAAWMLPLAALYLSYYGERHQLISFERFLLPLALPCTMLALMFADRALTRSGAGPAARLAVILAIAVGQVGYGAWWSLRELELRFGVNELIDRRVQFVRQSVPAGAAVFGEQNLLDTLDYYREYTLYWDELLHQDRLALNLSRSLQPGPDSLQQARATALQQRLLAVEEAVFAARIRALIDGRLAAGPGVYLVGKQETIDAFATAYAPFYDAQVVAELPGGATRYRLIAHAPAEPRAGRKLVRITRK